MMADEPEEERTVFQPGGAGRPGGMPGAVPPPPPIAPPPPPAPPPPQGQGYRPPEPQQLNPQAQRPASGASSAPAPGVISFATATPELYGPEPVVAAAGRLIHLATQIRTMPVGPDIKSLRRLVVDELEAFKKRARDLGLEARSVQLAHYMLCAFMDDAVLATPWGSESPWAQQSLLAAYHNDTYGGDRMFNFAEKMVQDPAREPRLMELLYLCLSLGFEGRAGVDARGESLVSRHRASMSTAIQRQREAQPGDLSPQWRGQKVAAGKFAPRVPLWAIAAGLGALALLIFAALLLRLSSSADTALEGLDRAVGNSVIVPPPPAPQSQTPTFDEMQAILQPDIEAQRLTLTREGGEIVVRLNNQGLFGAGQANPAGGWTDTFGRIAEAANLTSGPIAIEGHTDNSQPGASIAFPSNQALSEARADAVASAIRSAGLTQGDRISTRGFAATKPIASNDTVEGRSANRRVELRVANDIAWR
ncbi:MAG: type IVB secretion system protein IcmH/DotU [Erythrobacter sp.]|nr:MAG: type IVB secretion system protein IcmH/DotU [Erythrobacter sp.]